MLMAEFGFNTTQISNMLIATCWRVGAIALDGIICCQKTGLVVIKVNLNMSCYINEDAIGFLCTICNNWRMARLVLRWHSFNSKLTRCDCRSWWQ